MLCESCVFTDQVKKHPAAFFRDCSSYWRACLIASAHASEYHLITREDRLKSIAKDLVNHFICMGCLQDKGMIISIDKATAVRLYDKVRKYWKDKIDELK